MNENLNLIDILKDCPKGTKFYSIIYGDVYFEYIESSTPYPYPVTLKSSSGEKIAVTSKGQHYFYYNGECTLFPSREQRDWSKWHLPFVDGDIVTYENQIGIFKKYISEDNGLVECYVFLDNDLGICIDGDYYVEDFATEEEKQKLFKAIKKYGYNWNAEKKVLEKLSNLKFKIGNRLQWKGNSNSDITTVTKLEKDRYILNNGNYIKFGEEHLFNVILGFDPKTLKPFDKVLGRYNKFDTWKALYFSHISKNDKQQFYYCGTGLFIYCIPYNDDTEHLVGTDKEAPEYYRYWKE